MKSIPQPSNKEDAILIEYTGSDVLLVTFGGIAQGVGIPVFEFFNSLKPFNLDKIFIRDLSQAWYQFGVNEQYSSANKLAEYLRMVVKANQYSKVCFLGNSMGGYAAILFGTLIGVDEVVAFAPQTFIDPINRLLYRDHRWSKQIKNIYLRKWGIKRYLSLSSVLKRSSNKPKIQVYFSPESILDSAHASKLQDFPNVTTHSIPNGGHSVVKELKKLGKLDEILGDSVSYSPIH